MSTVLVTGAFGQIGALCTELLLARGHTVVGMDLRTDATETVACRLTGALIPSWTDLLDREAVHAVVAEHRPSAIVHLAAVYSPISYRAPALARKVNVDGTTHLIDAARLLDSPPLLLFASSAAVYGSRNPHRHPEPITADTPVAPIDQYGTDKVLGEALITGSGLPHAVLRLGGVISPVGAGRLDGDYLSLMRATPTDNRVHAVDARDAALAFANAVERGPAVTGRVLLIAGNDSYRHQQQDLSDDIAAATGLGRLGPRAGLPGDPADDRGWSFTGWFDTSESQALLDFQRHDWPDTVAWVAGASGQLPRIIGPALRPAILLFLRVQRRLERRGPYADPWTFLARRYGPEILASEAPLP
ncbi:NAD-dependent epimerase/dehydratase family protein [Nocardia jiangsuensis]|uniref:NAD-dependent epimerase/dehydratase family protein n=1 Tax=Nocardia jiangsuensis TaxID=1691563 RepID=A0ABV8E0E7_9NOCA